MAFYNNIPIIEGLEIVDDYQTLLSNLSLFNNAYDSYIVCNNKGPCKDGLSLNTLKENAIRAQNVLKNSINKLDNDIKITGTFDSAATLDQNDLLSKHQTIKSMRLDLDKKMIELNQMQNSLAHSNKQSYDATIYSGILLTALATSLLFFVFKQM